MNWIVVAIVLLLAHKEYMASPTPMKLPGYTQRLTPFIRHWEEANFDRVQLHDAHRKHIEQKRHRRKRELRTGEYGPANSIRLNFFAHDREFRLVLHQNPLSVFSNDVQIENTEGPIDYDISRIYTGSLEDDENSNIHAILTSDNLLDGTIETLAEHYYIEPAHRYSNELPKSGIHSIVYKLSDVISPDGKRTSKSSIGTSEAENCASERLRNNMLFDEMKRRKIKDVTKAQLKRHKRWLPEEISSTADRNPPLPLDLDVPYNDDVSIFLYNNNRKNDVTQLKSTTSTTTTTTKSPSTTHTKKSNQSHNSSYNNNDNNNNNNYNNNNNNNNDEIREDEGEHRQRNIEQATVITWRNTSTEFDNINKSSMMTKNIINPISTQDPISTSINSTTTTTHQNNNIIVNNYNPNSDSHYSNNNYNTNNNLRKTYTKHKNIIVSTYNNNNNDNRNSNNYNINNNNKNKNHNSNNYNQTFALFDDHFGEQSDDPDRYDHNSFFNSNWTTLFVDNIEQHRPSHKTHVEIITKNGATKKPNIIVNNYNPDIMVAPNFNSMLMTNLLSGRGNQDNNGNTGQMGNSARSLYDRKITCMLYLQADHTFFQKMGSDEASIEAITRHVQRANAIYKNTDFNNDGKPDNITFMIKRIKVHNMNAIKDPTYRFPGNYGVEKFLELFSEEDYDAFCLAYMFTYRDFEMGTLGLAWTGDLKNAGGVCEKNGHYRGSLKSLNTGIVTLLNYGKHVPPAVSHVTLAHEIGHNFGSPHDPEQCTPGGEDGNYIMFARATSGDKKNNNRFSPCSLKSIEPVLNSKARSPKGCFTEPQTSICGNGVVEQGEECDCGWEEDCKDSCCFPMSRHARLDEKPCTLTPRAMCSPSQGPCCTMDCKLKYGDKCRDDNGCRDPTFCDGRMPQCPPSINKPNKTICNKEFVCYMGECTGSICLAYGLESCQCIPGPQDDKIKSCELCCKLPGEDNPCRSSFEWNEPPFDVPDMFAKPGTPCNDYNGYCDVFQKCREVDPSGPLATLRKLLLSEESIATFKRWMQHNWYTVALAGVGVFVLLAISTKLMAKRSKLKLKSVTIIHSATTETVRLPQDNNGVIVHTAVRTKVPFKKKVRGERKSSKTMLNANPGNSKKFTKPGKSGLKFSANTTAQLRNSKVVTTVEQKKPPNKSKKNRVSNTAAASTMAAVGGTEKPVNNSGEIKKVKKLRKHSKEIIDYSSRNVGGASSSNPHTNTFGKVQKWLLESPIVAQPLSHIEHSSRVRKVMSKSQSTPERLVQKSPQKTKSLGNLANEKVKLQVVYKPPFRFALRLSKNAKIKTHAVNTGVGGAVNKSKRPTRLETKRQLSNAAVTAVEKTKRPALLIRGSTEEDNQILTLNEPNYETLNPKTAPSKLENPFYENLAYTQLNTASDAKSAGGARISRSSSKTNLEASSSSSNNINNGKSQRPHSYSRSNSLTTSNNPFSSNGTQRHSRKISETQASSPAHTNNFGSTQNLIQHSSSQSSNLAKSKKRSSLNLKSSLANKNGKDPPICHVTKRSNSNMNLRRNSSSNNMLPLSLPPDNDNKPIHQCLTTQQSHPPTSQSISMQSNQLSATTALNSYAVQRNSRASFSNIPRASLSLCAVPATQPAISGNPVSNNNFSFIRQSSATSAAINNGEQRRSRSNVPQMLTQTSIGSNASVSTTSSSASSAATHASSINAVDNNATHTRINSMRQQLPHNYYAPPPLLPSNSSPPTEPREFAPNNEVNSDVENLVS